MGAGAVPVARVLDTLAWCCVGLLPCTLVPLTPLALFLADRLQAQELLALTPGGLQVWGSRMGLGSHPQRRNSRRCAMLRCAVLLCCTHPGQLRLPSRLPCAAARPAAAATAAAATSSPRPRELAMCSGLCTHPMPGGQLAQDCKACQACLHSVPLLALFPCVPGPPCPPSPALAGLAACRPLTSPSPPSGLPAEAVSWQRALPRSADLAVQFFVPFAFSYAPLPLHSCGPGLHTTRPSLPVLALAAILSYTLTAVPARCCGYATVTVPGLAYSRSGGGKVRWFPHSVMGSGLCAPVLSIACLAVGPPLALPRQRVHCAALGPTRACRSGSACPPATSPWGPPGTGLRCRPATAWGSGPRAPPSCGPPGEHPAPQQPGGPPWLHSGPPGRADVGLMMGRRSRARARHARGSLDILPSLSARRPPAGPTITGITSSLLPTGQVQVLIEAALPTFYAGRWQLAGQGGMVCQCMPGARWHHAIALCLQRDMAAAAVRCRRDMPAHACAGGHAAAVGPAPACRHLWIRREGSAQAGLAVRHSHPFP